MRKRLQRSLALFLSMVMILSCMAVPAAGYSQFNIGMLEDDTLVIIDGEDTEEIWQDALIRELTAEDFNAMGTPPGCTPVLFQDGIIKFLWSEAGLYFYVEYHDTTESIKVPLGSITYADHV